MFPKHFRIDDGTHFREHAHPAAEYHLLRALRIALNEIDIFDSMLLCKVIERVDWTDDHLRAFPAFSLSLITFLEIVSIRDRTKGCGFVRRRNKKFQVPALAVKAHMNSLDLPGSFIQPQVALESAEGIRHRFKRIDRAVLMRRR